MEVLALVIVVSLAIAIHHVGFRAGQRWVARLRAGGTRAGALRWMVGFFAVAALAPVAAMVWANTGDRTMNTFGWAGYGLLLVLFVVAGAWALARTRSR
jgi:hypothetical protein